MFRKSLEKYPTDPRFRAYGRARIDIAQRAQSRADWDRMWKESIHPFSFSWGGFWKQCIEYRVEDFAAEVGFFIDVLGFPVLAFDPDYAMFTSPDQDFTFSVVPAGEQLSSTSPDALRIQFMVTDILETAEELERRGVVFEQFPQPIEPDASLYIGYFRTPHGICIDLWGEIGREEQDSQDSLPNQPVEFVKAAPLTSGETEIARPDERLLPEKEEAEEAGPETGAPATARGGAGNIAPYFVVNQDDEMSARFEYEYEDDEDVP